MNDLAMQMMPMQSTGAQGVYRSEGLQGLLGGQTEGGDIFAMILAGLLDDAKDTEEINIADLLMKLGRMEQDTEEESQKNAMEMMTAMLGMPIPQMMPMDATAEDAFGGTTAPGQTVVTDTVMQDAALLGAMLQQSMQTDTRATDTVNFEIPEGIPTVAEVTETAIDPQFTDSGETQNAEVDLEMELSELGETSQGEKTDPLDEYRFQSALADVKREIETAPKPKETTTDPIDIDALQAQVNAGKFLPDTLVGKLENAAAAEDIPIATQLAESIRGNIEVGQNEFVVKLTPEGLGEIAVKITETEGHLAMSIITSSKDVARALETEMASLQNAMKPYQVEVQEIATSSEFASGGQFGGLTDGQAQFYDRQNQPREVNVEFAGSVKIDREEPRPATVSQLNQMLHTYI